MSKRQKLDHDPSPTMPQDDSIPPPLHAPTSKEKKYDRQLRLWAATGQSALEDANVLLINSGTGVAGVEALKNLVLPGIGRFTILDPAVVDQADLGVNFFLEDEDVGNFRAEACCRNLAELNPDVKGTAITEPYETFIAKYENLARYNFVILTLPISLDVQRAVAEFSTSSGTPIFYLHCLGFYSHFTAQLPKVFPIVDTHPDPASTTDLRLLGPWSEISHFAREKMANLDSMDDEEHGHIPYVIILLHYLEEWKASHNGRPPVTYKEKSEFRETVRGAARTNNAEGGEENFDEAAAAVLKTVNFHAPGSAVMDVFNADECQRISQDSPPFWVIAHSVKQFYDETGCLPLSGSFPDMKAKSKDYIQLQNMYKMKARRDAEYITNKVRAQEASWGRHDALIDPMEIEALCKNAAHLKLIRGSTYPPPPLQGVHNFGEGARMAAKQLTNPDSLMTLSVALLAYDQYAQEHEGKRQVWLRAHEKPDDYEVEVAKMSGMSSKLIDDLLKEAGQTIDDPEYSDVKDATSNIVQELCRANGAEMHNIAAVTGGVLAQEAIKIITRQYVPIDNTFLYDGVASKTSVIRL